MTTSADHIPQPRHESIGVVTVTRGRPEKLRRAMASVYAQDFAGEIEHVVVIDDDPAIVPVVEAAPVSATRRAVARLVPRPPEEVGEAPGDRRGVYPRLARLFNAGARFCSTTWVSYLDDDNEFEPNHLSSLYERAMETGAKAVHSGRLMLWEDGSPHLEERWHTVADPVESARIFDLMCDRGVRRRGSNVLLDRADPVPVPEPLPTSSVIQDDDPVFLVDQSVWLLRRDLVLEVPFPEVYTEADYRTNTAPDDKFLAALLRSGVELQTTGLPTVRYYLGGISNYQDTALEE